VNDDNPSFFFPRCKGEAQGPRKQGAEKEFDDFHVYAGRYGRSSITRGY
jgi:hypothetical protein